jgi:hypothetical protein
MTGSIFGAEETAAGTFGSIPIGTGKTAVQGQLHNAASEPFFQPGSDRIKVCTSKFIFHKNSSQICVILL